MTTLQLELEKLAQQTKRNYQDVLASQYVSLCDKHGVKMTLEESREALTRLGYISVEGKVVGV